MSPKVFMNLANSGAQGGLNQGVFDMEWHVSHLHLFFLTFQPNVVLTRPSTSKTTNASRPNRRTPTPIRFYTCLAGSRAQEVQRSKSPAKPLCLEKLLLIHNVLYPYLPLYTTIPSHPFAFFPFFRQLNGYPFFFSFFSRSSPFFLSSPLQCWAKWGLFSPPPPPGSSLSSNVFFIIIPPDVIAYLHF